MVYKNIKSEYVENVLVALNAHCGVKEVDEERLESDDCFCAEGFDPRFEKRRINPPFLKLREH